MSRIILGNIFGANGSVNFYMFHGGTNFGFMNGANILGYNGQYPTRYLAPPDTYNISYRVVGTLMNSRVSIANEVRIHQHPVHPV